MRGPNKHEVMHCGSSRHTEDSCFKLIGYPEWWDDLQWKKAATNALVNLAGGKALFTGADPTGGEHTEESGEEEMEEESAPTKWEGKGNTQTFLM